MYDKPGMLVHAYNSRTEESEVEDHEFKASMVYIVKPCLKIYM
jgi:hypothetical protein